MGRLGTSRVPSEGVVSKPLVNGRCPWRDPRPQSHRPSCLSHWDNSSSNGRSPRSVTCSLYVSYDRPLFVDLFLFPILSSQPPFQHVEIYPTDYFRSDSSAVNVLLDFLHSLTRNTNRSLSHLVPPPYRPRLRDTIPSGHSGLVSHVFPLSILYHILLPTQYVATHPTEFRKRPVNDRLLTEVQNVLPKTSYDFSLTLSQTGDRDPRTTLPRSSLPGPLLWKLNPDSYLFVPTLVAHGSLSPASPSETLFELSRELFFSLFSPILLTSHLPC